MSKRDLETEFEAKYNNYGNMLYKIAFLYLGNASDCEDVLQDVFTKYLCGKAEFKNSEHEKAWFIRVTQNKCLDYLKKSGRKNVNVDDKEITDNKTKSSTSIFNSFLISIPCGQTSENLPVGLQLLGPAFGEVELLKAAAACEKEFA